MRVATLSVGLPVLMRDGDGWVRTGIRKAPIAGAVRATRLGLEGDGQADLENHGGEFKAVYAYSADHYPAWRAELGREDLVHGHFGENLTLDGLQESSTFLGDQWRIGGARLAVTQPRVPCFKLGLRFGDPGIVKRFSQSRRTGCYLRVLQEGTIEAGATVELLERGDARVPIDRLYAALMLEKGKEGREILAAALENRHLAPAWRSSIRERLDRRLGP